MELISTHFVKKSEVGYHGNLFGGIMLAWLDEAAAAYAAQVADTPQIVTKHIAALTFEKPVRPGQIIKIYGSVDISRLKKFVKNVPLLAWVVVGVVVAALIIFKISEANGHPGYNTETPVVSPSK